MGTIADSLRASLRAMAESDARMFRELAEIDRSLQSIIDDAPAAELPSSTELEIAAAIRLLKVHGYTVMPPA